jgi:cyclopropane fatty-acyl-phospholipid synthase-like methyltransferase
VATGAVPERLRWAVDMLDVRPGDRLLEIGCGRGVAVGLVCERLVDGHISAIDRSSTAIAAARERNGECIAAGKADLRVLALEDAAALDGERFDKIFAVNVNLFWTRSPGHELDLVRRLLAPDGALFLCYEPPTAARATDLTERLATVLADHGFTTATLTATTARSALLCLAARPAH